MRFRLVVYVTDEENKHLANEVHEYLGDRDAIFFLWWTFAKVQKKRYVEVFNLAGHRLNPENGLAALQDFNP